MSKVDLIYREINLRNLRNVTLLTIYAIISFFFLVNGEAIFDYWSSSWTWTTIIYLLGVSIFLGIQEKLPQDLQVPITKQLIGFLICFLLTTILFYILSDMGILFGDIPPLPSRLLLPTALFQLVIVVTSEEIIFRGVIYRFLHQFNWVVAVLLSAFLFSLFHFAVYQGNIGAFIIAFVMGIILALCVQRWNLGVAIGLHFAWNAYIIGITALSIIGITVLSII
jgi:membrane protease YdiL (CAAX protease family)